MHLQEIVNTFYKTHSEKPTIVSAPLDSALPMAKPIVKLPTKQKQGRPAKGAIKCIKWDNKEDIQVSTVLNKARSQQVAGNFSPWRIKRWEAYIHSLTIGSSTPLKTK